MDRLGTMAQGVFITGTDTDVGKTMVSSTLLAYFNAAGLKTLGVKPVCCGGREDVTALQAVNSTAGYSYTDQEINPLFLSEPAAPVSLDHACPSALDLATSLNSLSDDGLLIEGAGGWAVPVTVEWGMDDLAVALGRPVIIVVANKLGALNHSLLTARAVLQAGLPLLGYVLNTIEESEYSHAQQTNREVLDALMPCPCLAEIPLGGGSVSSAPLRKALKMPNLLDLPLHFQISNS